MRGGDEDPILRPRSAPLPSLIVHIQKCCGVNVNSTCSFLFDYLIFFFFSIPFSSLSDLLWGWQWGGAGPKDGIFVPAPHGFFLPHPRPAPHDGENFLPHPRPLRPREAPPYIVKLYFLLIFPTTITIFSNKMTYFNNKNILKIINKFILSNQTNF